ncbi:glycosyltransferase [Vibrio orientalis CIP 102891 = ATCC 33934]|uniref:Glycosyltransferase n=1 Tax=Vibrio orientalis CIP 102891 = ATCC 33934 TaxID=675816 RepID=C9QKS6_VIBOR|nr:glycosyltransferase [Vibrio orientalis]EEX92411.1 glycosyltransferase [Vibrio orientalis CIP 102891 = ATCC 33934]EGU48952.1 glycosyltransferase [Vibrio orientalis CIP 102891 = ATCC 33934]
MAKKILFVHYGDNWIRGSEKCLLDLIHYLDNRQYRPYVWTNNEALLTALDTDFIPGETSDFPLLLGWKAPKYDVSEWYRLFKKACDIIENKKIDLIHVNSAAPCQWMLAAARAKKVPLVTQLHSPYPARERLTTGLHLSPHIISVSRYVAKSLLQDGYPEDKLSIIHNGIDVKTLEAQSTVDVKRELLLPENSFVFATVGSLIKRKGVDRILTALRHVTLEYPHVHLAVIGDGPLRKELEQQADYLHLSANVHFVGEQNNVVGWLKGCNGFVSGARSEAFGLVVAEAALAKLPIVAPFEGGIPEFIRHGKTGILYPNSKIAPLANAMRIAVANPNLCKRLGLQAYQYISLNHSLNNSCRKIEALYRQLLSQPQGQVRSFLHTFSPLKTFVANRLALGEQHG